MGTACNASMDSDFNVCSLSRIQAKEASPARLGLYRYADVELLDPIKAMVATALCDEQWLCL